MPQKWAGKEIAMLDYPIKYRIDLSNILFSDEAIEEWKKERRLNK
jgi:hypothetical protein